MSNERMSNEPLCKIQESGFADLFLPLISRVLKQRQIAPFLYAIASIPVRFESLGVPRSKPSNIRMDRIDDANGARSRPRCPLHRVKKLNSADTQLSCN